MDTPSYQLDIFLLCQESVGNDVSVCDAGDSLRYMTARSEPETDLKILDGPLDWTGSKYWMGPWTGLDLWFRIWLWTGQISLYWVYEIPHICTKGKKNVHAFIRVSCVILYCCRQLCT